MPRKKQSVAVSGGGSVDVADEVVSSISELKASEKNRGVEEILIRSIANGPNVRDVVHDDAMKALVESVRQCGVLEPLIVNHIHVDVEDVYVLIAGARRLFAAKEVGLETVRCVVFEDLSSSELLTVMLTENLLRLDLNPVEEANGFYRVLKTGVTQEALASRLGCSQEYISNRLRLLEAPEDLLSEIISCEITPSHVLELFSYKKHGIEVFYKCVENLPRALKVWQTDFGYSLPVSKLSERVLKPSMDQLVGPVLDPLSKVFRPHTDLHWGVEFNECRSCSKYLFFNYCTDRGCLTRKVAVMEARLSSENEARKESSSGSSEEEKAAKAAAVAEDKRVALMVYDDFVRLVSSLSYDRLVQDLVFSKFINSNLERQLGVTVLSKEASPEENVRNYFVHSLCDDSMYYNLSLNVHDVLKITQKFPDFEFSDVVKSAAARARAVHDSSSKNVDDEEGSEKVSEEDICDYCGEPAVCTYSNDDMLICSSCKEAKADWHEEVCHYCGEDSLCCYSSTNDDICEKCLSALGGSELKKDRKNAEDPEEEEEDVNDDD